MNTYEVATLELSKKEVIKDLRRCSNRNSMILLGFNIIVYSFAYFILPLISKILNNFLSENELNSANKLLIFIVQFIIAVPILLIIGNRKTNHKVKTYFQRPQASASFIFKWCIIIMGLCYAANYLFSIIFLIIQEIINVEFNAVDLIANDTNFDRLVMFIAIAILAPIFEELLFRGTLLTHTIKYGQWFAAFVIGISFGLFHANYAQIFYASVMGIMVCFLDIKTKSIIPGMIVHFSLNLIGALQSMVLSKIDISTIQESPNEFYNQIIEKPFEILTIISLGFLVIGLSITGVIMFIIEIVKNKNVFKFKNPCPQISSSKKAAVYLTAPITIILIVIILAITILNAIA